jgi:hypothetical protein
VPVDVTFDEEGLARFSVEAWVNSVSDVANTTSSNVEILELTLRQNLELGGLSQATATLQYKVALLAAYKTALPGLFISIVVGDSTTSGAQLRQLRSNNVVIPVAITIDPSATNDVASSLDGPLFAGNVTQELINIGESETTVDESTMAGMEVVFSIKAKTTDDIRSSIINNENFASDITASAVSNGMIGANAVAVVDVDLIVITTLAPTSEPTASPSESPTLAPSAGSCADSMQNFDETGIDCGGSCHPCGIGEGCALNADCRSSLCQGSICTTLSPTHSPTNSPTYLPCPDAPELNCGVISASDCVDISWVPIIGHTSCYELEVECPIIPTASPTIVPPDEIDRIFTEVTSATVGRAISWVAPNAGGAAGDANIAFFDIRIQETSINSDEFQQTRYPVSAPDLTFVGIWSFYVNETVRYALITRLLSLLSSIIRTHKRRLLKISHIPCDLVSDFAPIFSLYRSGV